MSTLAVLVRYQIPLAESPTFRGLQEALRAQPDLARQLAVMIWDNSPAALTPSQQPPGLFYRHAHANLGPAGAYNEAMQYALARGDDWMLLLDQDTAITSDFLTTMLRHANQLALQTRIAAIAPTVRVRGLVVSPRRQRFNSHCQYPAAEIGIAPGEAFAINSGCLIRVAALRKIGGFSTDFWLDYSDMYVFHQFFLHGLKVWRATDAELQHDMSIMDYDRLMTPWRYRNYSFAEGAFNDLYKGRLENTVQTLRLFVRAVKQRFKYRNPAFSRITRGQLWYRLRVPRSARTAQWFTEGRKRLEPQTENVPRQERSSSDEAA